MMRAHEFETIDHTTLQTVAGGMEVEGEGSVDIGPGRGNINVRGRYRRTNYESCVSAVTSRPNWTPRQLVQACGRPPEGG